MIDTVREFLESRSIDQWKYQVKKREVVRASFPAEAGQDKTALQSRVLTTTSTLNLFRVFHRGGRKYCGQSSVDWESENLPQGVEVQILDAWEEALSQEDPWFPLEIQQEVAMPSSTSSFSKQELTDWIIPLQEVLHRAVEKKEFFLQNEFIQLERGEDYYEDCFGRKLVQVSYRGLLDISLLPRTAPQTQPRTAELRFSEFAPHLIASFVEDQGQLVQDSQTAQPYTPVGDFNLLLRGNVVREFFQYLIRQLSGLSLYTGLSSNQLEKTLWNRETRGDALSVHALTGLYNSPENSLFDEQGIVIKPFTLLEDGMVKNILTSQEIAHYLALPLTGMNANFSVSPGTLDLTALKFEKTLEISHFRTLQLDEKTGEFSAEVDFAYLYDAGKKTSVFGFFLRGNLQELLTNCFLSREIGVWENYEGPEYLRIPQSFLSGV